MMQLPNGFDRQINMTLLVGLLAACGGTQASPKAPGTMSRAERMARLQSLYAREMSVAPAHDLQLLDLAQAKLESLSAPRTECAKDGNNRKCIVVAKLGKDADGDESEIACAVEEGLPAFGTLVKGLLGEVRLDETPAISVRELGEGTAVTFVANTSHETDNTIFIGTAKIAAHYAHGYTAACSDLAAGGRATFDRVTSGFFGSLRYRNSKSSALFAHASRLRVGHQTLGFQYAEISKSDSDTGFRETSLMFFLNTDGKTWSVLDVGNMVERDEGGAVQKAQRAIWADGHGPALLTAKIADEGKLRLKYEIGQKINSLELAPKVPLNTELWSAPRLAQIARDQSYTYAITDLEDSDPAFRYVTLRASDAGVLLETVEGAAKSKKQRSESGKGEEDEIHIDSDGLVTKEVSASHTSERVHLWGQLPELLRGKATAPAKGGR